MNDYVIGYDKGIKKDRSSLIISKYNNSNLYVLAEFYDEKADLLNEIITALQQENKQLKEDFEVLKKLQMISNDILNELEEWLCGEKIVVYNVDGKVGILRGDILNKIQELKEKYK